MMNQALQPVKAVSMNNRNFRPKYETTETLEYEEDFKYLFESAFPEVELRKMPIQYRIDFAVLNKSEERIIGMVEYRTRRYTKKKMDELGGVKISLMKILTGIEMSEKMGIPVQVFFSFLDSPRGEYHRFLMNRENYDRCQTGWMNFKGRNDPQDCEPVVVIPIQTLDHKVLM